MDEKAVREVEVAFAQRLLQQAVQMTGNSDEDGAWEDQEVARLLVLLLTELGLGDVGRQRELVRFLDDSECVTPGVLAHMRDAGIELTPGQILQLLLTQCATTDARIATVDDCLEQDLLNVQDTIVQEKLYDVVDRYTMSREEQIRYAAVICGHARKKKSAGKLLDVFISQLSFTEAAYFVKEVISHDFFADLSGKMTKLYACLPEEVECELRRLLAVDGEEGGGQLNSDGELVYSDEDEHGNLRGFIVEEGEEELTSEPDYEEEEQEEEPDSDKELDITVDVDNNTAVEEDEDNEIVCSPSSASASNHYEQDTLESSFIESEVEGSVPASVNTPDQMGHNNIADVMTSSAKKKKRRRRNKNKRKREDGMDNSTDNGSKSKSSPQIERYCRRGVIHDEEDDE